MKLLFTLILTAAAGAAQVERPPLPSPDQILRIQEAQARERSMAERLVVPERPPAATAAPARTLNEAEQREVRDALERFSLENPGLVIDARTGRPVERKPAAGNRGDGHLR